MPLNSSNHSVDLMKHDSWKFTLSADIINRKEAPYISSSAPQKRLENGGTGC